LGIVIYNSDFLFLRVLRDATAVGYYAAAYTLVTFFLNVGAMYNLSLLPSLTRLRADRPEQLRLYHTALAQVFAAGLPAALGGSLLAAALVGLVFGPVYAVSALPFALLVWCIPLNLLRDVPLMALMSAGEERAVFRVTLSAAALNLALNAALIPRLGLFGAAAATVLTETVRMILAMARARVHGFSLPGPGRFGRAGIAGVAMGGVLLAVAPGSVWAAVPLGAGAYLVALLATGGLKLRRRRWPVLSV
jgi:O-antigen/teichoic acid export membrane protein